ncbi:unnamed protein product [Periconia digitata]|uniref:Uncharacterized protein n=1 Tax=Periconia digitata TaxID=1303443 RepID=A0A9W4URI7_9PLEO|nr:unnamed protein product [Periconia digitata]
MGSFNKNLRGAVHGELCDMDLCLGGPMVVPPFPIEGANKTIINLDRSETLNPVKNSGEVNVRNRDMLDTLEGWNVFCAPTKAIPQPGV